MVMLQVRVSLTIMCHVQDSCFAGSVRGFRDTRERKFRVCFPIG